MMSLEADLRFTFTDAAALIELPYGGRAFSAIAALPPAGRGIEELLAGLDLEAWADWMARIETTEPAAAAVVLPRVELEYDRLLNGDLQALGMRDAFDDTRADFSRMTPISGPGEVFINRVQQKSFLKVDERGTEAAAATFVEMVRVTSVGGPPAFVFDRPFLFAIRERLTGTVLFLGVIGDPTA